MFYSCSSEQEKEMTAEQIWEKYIETTFGSKKPNVQSRCSMIRTISDTIEITTIVKVKSPDKVYQEVTATNGKHVIYILNSGTGKIIYPNKQIEMTYSEIISFSKLGLIFPELGYTRAKLLGKEVVNNNECYKIQNGDDDNVFIFYIDCKTFLCLRTIHKKSTIEYLERKKINGISLAKSYKIIDDYGEWYAEYIEDFINCDISDDIYELE